MLIALLLTSAAADPRALLLKSANRGRVKAEVQLALSLQDPRQGPMDLAASERWLRAAAATGDIEGEFYLGRLLHLVPHAHHDWVEARLWYEKAAAQGNLWALNNLGLLAESENGAAGQAKAVSYFRKSAEGGEIHGEGNLARCLHEGDGVVKNDAEARIWYGKAGAQGDGHSEATLGAMFWSGEGGSVDFVQARRHLERSAALEDAWGTLNLGIFEEEGHGKPPDPAAAAALYARAAQLGDAAALDRLGQLYRAGRGVPKDPAKSRGLYLRAADAGELHAWSSLGNLYMDGDGVPKSDAEAVKCFFMGAYLGEPQCENNVGAFYHHGRGGLQRDLVNAYAWFKIAEADGDPTARGNLASLDQQIGSVQRARGWLLITSLRDEIRRRRIKAKLD